MGFMKRIARKVERGVRKTLSVSARQGRTNSPAPLPGPAGNGLLPPGDHYSLIWSIGKTYGGMTTVVLQRSTSFSALDDRPVTILTLSPDLDVQAKEAELRDSGRLGADAHLRNLWQDLRTWSDEQLRGLRSGNTGALIDPDELLEQPEGRQRVRVKAEGGWQVDHYRPEGGLLVTERPVPGAKRKDARRITLYDSRGAPIGRWKSIRSFYQAWLDAVIAGRQAYLISDSKFAGSFVYDYRRDNVVTCQVMHTPYLADPAGSIFGRLNKGKLEIVSHLDFFDFAVTLTDRQRTDMLDSQISAGAIRTVPNFAHDTHGDPDTPRDPSHGAIIARLSPEKRVDHVVRALAQCPSDSSVHLDVYGEGPERNGIMGLIDDLGVRDRVTLHGHVDHAKRFLQDASFLVLASRFEGQGLVVSEAMSAGCIPIAYDFKYGPADIITDGRDGFLVPAGDIDALAAAIRRVSELSTEELRRMRQAARLRVAEFYERPNVELWGRTMREFGPKEPRGKLPTVGTKLTGFSLAEGALEFRVRLNSSDGSVDDALLVWQHRSKPKIFGRQRGLVLGSEFVCRAQLERFEDIPAGVLDLYVDVFCRGEIRRIRISHVSHRADAKISRYELYSTVNGNASLRVGVPTT
jgi:poly(glycerol-phosphate) alpha-glucosyltransferase